MEHYPNPPQKGDVEIAISINFGRQFDTFDYVVNGKKVSIKNVKEITTTIQEDFQGVGKYSVITSFHGTVEDKKNNGYKENVIFSVDCHVSVTYHRASDNIPHDSTQIIVNFEDKNLFFTTDMQTY